MREADGWTGKFTTQTTILFQLDGGIYVGDWVSGAWNSASLVINRLGPDNATYQPVFTAVTANGSTAYTVPLYLPRGFYEAVVSVGTPTDPVYVRLTRVQAE